MKRIRTFAFITTIMATAIMGIATWALAGTRTIENAFLTVQETDGMVAVTRNSQIFATFVLPKNAEITEKKNAFHVFLPTEMVKMTVSLADAQPFATISVQPTVGDVARTVSSVKLPKISLNLAYAPKEYKALGSAGLTAIDGHKGSYMFLTVAHPETRDGVVAAWATSLKGSGIVFSGVSEDGKNIEIQPELQYGRCEIPAKNDTKNKAKMVSDTFVIGAFGDCLTGLETYADYVANVHKIVLKPQISGYCTWYSNRNGGAGTEESTREFADVAVEKLAPFGMEFFQIDDYWQLGSSNLNGPAKNFTSHNPKGPYPSGMKPTAEYLNSRGLIAGVWFMPFSGNWNDSHYADKQEWFVKSAITYPKPGEKNTRRYSMIHQKEGAPYETYWGGTSLDMTDKEVEKYVRDEVDQIANKWGYKYFKYDGIWTAMACEQLYVNDEYCPDDLGLQIFDDSTLTNVEAYRKGLKMVRTAAGDDVFILGCNVSQNMRTLGASYGLVDAMRIGPDNGANWAGICAGPIRGTARYFYNGRVWYNDPDPVYVRDSIPLSHAQLITSWAAISGQLYAFSDWLPELSDERVNVLQRTIAPARLYTARPLDLFESKLAHVWKVTAPEKAKKPDAAVFGFFNWSEKEPLMLEKSAKQLGLDAEATYVGYDFWADTFVPPFKGKMVCTLPGGTCRIISIAKMKENEPVLVSTSRHVTSPLFEVENVRWDAEKMTLTGTSTLVKNDPYELRFVLPEGMKVAPVQDITRTATQKGRTLRVRFTPEKSGKATWTVNFEMGDAPTPAPKTVENLTGKSDFTQIRLNWENEEHFGFVLTRKEGGNILTQTVNETFYVDMTVKAGKTYNYAIQTRGWDGALSAPATVEVAMPKSIAVPAVPPMPEVNIADMEWVKAQNGCDSVKKNQSVAGKSLKLQGKTYEKGVGVHANASLTYNVPKGMTRFVAIAGLDDLHAQDNRRSVVIRIWTDVCEMGEPAVLVAESPILSNATERAWHFDIPLDERVRQIRLEVNDAEDGIACDHVDWVNTGFLKK